MSIIRPGERIGPDNMTFMVIRKKDSQKCYPSSIPHNALADAEANKTLFPK